MIRFLENFLSGRTKVNKRTITFCEAIEIIRNVPKPILIDQRYKSGARSTQTNSAKIALETLNTFFAPSVRKATDGEVFYKTDFDGVYTIYSGKKDEKHYLDVKNLIIGKSDVKGHINIKGTFSF